MEISKLMIVADNDSDKARLLDVFEPFQDTLTLNWGIHPVILPLQFGIVTMHGVSKKQGAIDAVRRIGISFDEMLAIGDSTSDWQFIKLCKYGAAMGNATEELKELVRSKKEGCFAIGKDVDENGAIALIDKFLELK